MNVNFFKKFIILTTLFVTFLLSGCTELASGEAQQFAKEILALEPTDIEKAMICFDEGGFDPLGQYRLTEQETAELLDLLQGAVRSRISSGETDSLGDGGHSMFFLHITDSNRKIIVANNVTVGGPERYYTYWGGGDDSVIEEFYHKCCTRVQEDVKRFPRLFADMEEGAFSQVTLRSGEASRELTAEEREELTDYLQIRFQYFCENRAAIEENYPSFDPALLGRASFATPVEEEILAAFDVTMTDGERVTVEIGEEHLVMNEVGYVMGGHNVLKNWTLELLA